tara:strand:- start:16589 stop:17671 length:1083 start_codon:yes stop_codon:yes gene_type:complete
MTNRKLASIRKISSIEAIPEADNLVKVNVDGWSVVSAKQNGFMPGDLVVFFEVDSFLPIEERYEFLRKSCYKETKHLGSGFRLKTIKLRGTISQGLVMPLEKGENSSGVPVYVITGKNGEKHEVEVGDDVTEVLGVQFYEKPIDSKLSGIVRGNFPALVRKTDQERIQNILGELMYDMEAKWEVSMKLDGSSMTVYRKNDEIHVCSRNIDLVETEENTFWQVANRLKIPSVLNWLGRNLAFQGELMGPGVQGNREWLKSHTFFLFDIWDIDKQRYFTPQERRSLVSTINDSGFELPHIHVFGEKQLKDFGTSYEEVLFNLLTYAQGPSIYNAVKEGIVFKRNDGQFSFKAISVEYLLSEK